MTRRHRLATGGNAKTRETLRWLQAVFEAHRILGKPVRELRDLYSKRNISKPKNKRVKADSLTDEIKVQRQ